MRRAITQGGVIEDMHIIVEYNGQTETFENIKDRILIVKNKSRGNYLEKRWSLMVPKTVQSLIED